MSNTPSLQTAPPPHVEELPAAQAYPRGPLTGGVVFDALLLEKARRRLTAFCRGSAVRVYLVALGTNPAGPKEREGDGRTPEGRYVIDGKNPNSGYHLNLGISYPDDEDKARATALGVPPGGDIKIHGLAPKMTALGPLHRQTDWTRGCIAVTNEEMEELFRHTEAGTPIEIVP